MQLPPDYHHLRSYPVLMVLHGSREKAEDTLKRFYGRGGQAGLHPGGAALDGGTRQGEVPV